MYQWKISPCMRSKVTLSMCVLLVYGYIPRCWGLGENSGNSLLVILHSPNISEMKLNCHIWWMELKSDEVPTNHPSFLSTIKERKPSKYEASGHVLVVSLLRRKWFRICVGSIGDELVRRIGVRMWHMHKHEYWGDWEGWEWRWVSGKTTSRGNMNKGR